MRIAEEPVAVAAADQTFNGGKRVGFQQGKSMIIRQSKQTRKKKVPGFFIKRLVFHDKKQAAFPGPGGHKKEKCVIRVDVELDHGGHGRIERRFSCFFKQGENFRVVGDELHCCKDGDPGS